MLKSLFNKVVPTQVFSCECCEFFKNTYFEQHMHLNVVINSNEEQNLLANLYEWDKIYTFFFI